MRKFGPFDGGYLISPYDLTPYIIKYQGYPNRHLPLIREYREKLANYLYQGSIAYEELDQLYKLAENYYETANIVEGDLQEQLQIERTEWEGIKQIRRENYQYLLNSISGIQELSPVFPVLQEKIMPLGLPVYVSEVSRDWLFDQLGSAGIGLTIHWDELLRDSRLNKNAVAVDMASRILTLVIDQRTSHKQMDYMVQILYDRIKQAKLHGISVSE
jgi:dTDP-4-amino-4,6-dideoxygalactose transaminase